MRLLEYCRTPQFELCKHPSAIVIPSSVCFSLFQSAGGSLHAIFHQGVVEEFIWLQALHIATSDGDRTSFVGWIYEYAVSRGISPTALIDVSVLTSHQDY